MNRRNLFKSLTYLAIGIAAAPVANLLREKKPRSTWEGTNIPRDAFAEVQALEQRVQKLTGAYSYTFAYLDKNGNIIQPNIHVYSTET